MAATVRAARIFFIEAAPNRNGTPVPAGCQLESRRGVFRGHRATRWAKAFQWSGLLVRPWIMSPNDPRGPDEDGLRDREAVGFGDPEPDRGREAAPREPCGLLRRTGSGTDDMTMGIVLVARRAARAA